MSIQLNPFEMIEILEAQKHPDAVSHKAILIANCRLLAQAVLTLVPNVSCDLDEIELWAGEVYAGFHATNPPAPIPSILKGYDDGGWEDAA